MFMGELVEGVWHRSGIDAVLSKGTLRRPPSLFRNWISPDESTPRDARVFEAEADRYHLYVSLACPWAHRTLIMRNLKGLAGIVGVSVVHWHMGDDGWTFDAGPDVIPDRINGVKKLYQLYLLADPHCTTRVTVPVLWDKKERTIVSNESADIIRMFNSAFDGLGAKVGNYYPKEQRAEIDEINSRVYANFNNGVYAAGFAGSQAAYDAAVEKVFDTLEWLEKRLSRQRFLLGHNLTEADIRLFTTLIRFDAVYFGHFKCNRRPIVGYPSLWRYTKELYGHPDIRPTVNFQHIKGHYYGSHRWINPSGIIPIGPDLDFSAPSDRNLSEREH
jgi:glutathionyl-hydroquinone reductase